MPNKKQDLKIIKKFDNDKDRKICFKASDGNCYPLMDDVRIINDHLRDTMYQTFDKIDSEVDDNCSHNCSHSIKK